MDLLLRLNEELGKTFLVVTHDAMVGERAKRTLQLDKGVIQSDRARDAAAGAAG